MTLIEIHTKDGAQKNEFTLSGEIVLANLKAPAIHEHINIELIAALALKLGITRQQISIHSGHEAHIKFVKIDSKTKEQIFAALGSSA